MKTEAQLIYERIHDIQQRLEQRFEQTGKDETEPFYKHRFVAELLEDLKGAIEDIGNCKELSGQTDKFIDSQFWDKI
jgi:hypothetical protein